MRYLFLILGLLVASSSFGATVGSLVLSGSVAKNVSIAITPEAGSTTLDLTSSVMDLKVATVTEKSNDKDGYTVTLASANSGTLKNGTLEVIYTAKYSSVAVTLSSAPVIITNQATQTGVIKIDKNFSISYIGIPLEDLMSGVYSDTLTFTISAK